MTALGEATGAGRATRPAFVAVWDPLVRIVHWSLVAFFAAAWVSAEEAERLHEIAGYAVAVLIALRLVWGVIGSRHARFTDFVYRPSAVIAYTRECLMAKPRRYLGHNPAGGAMVLALVLGLAAVSVTGVMLTRDAYWAVEWVEEVHEAAAIAVLGLVVVHILGVILASVLHRENLVGAMITGRKRQEQ
jgi:cytochrome b